MAEAKRAHWLVQSVVGLVIGGLIALVFATLFNISEASRDLSRDIKDAKARTTAPAKLATKP